MSSTQTPTFTLYRGWTSPNELVWSPFVTKVEFRLRHSGNSTYTSEAGSTSQSPKGKIPYIKIDDGTTSDTFSDSTLIIKRLAHEGHIKDLNGGLSPERKLEDLAIRALLEEKLYFYHMQERWISNYYAHRDHILGHLALPVRSVVGLLIYRNIKAVLHGQGTGRFSEEEIEMYRFEIWRAIEDRLVVSRRGAEGEGEGEEPFWVLGGDDPTEADGSLFGFITSVLVATSCPRSREVVRGFPTVMEYADRIFKKYFGGFKHWDH